MQSLNISSAALRSVQQALDTTANNLANIDTVGYKRRTASFSELLSDSLNEQPAADRQQRSTPPGLRIGSGARIGLTKLDMAPGSAKITDVPTDLMIEGEGFFLVSRPLYDNNGTMVGEAYRFTRNGAFQVRFDDKLGSYVLHNAAGDLLTDVDGTPIMITGPVRNLQVSPEGVVTNDGTTVGQIGVWKVPNPDQLTQVGENEYDAELASGMTPYSKYEQSAAKIRQGALEASNVNLQEEMTQLVNVQRAYQLNARAIAIADQMMGIANSLRSR
ncbi:flagellar hook-basal body protein [Brevibacillus sp. WF146]|jgi:flagellar basal-body rod protein FlgG|uniref:flagellar hook-basal body protein n=1 Tax=Brevibacillus sp. WF146 TaxID=319501 RepID=UPI0007EC394F|nr:flagellar hook-basal body protein [Brevibacillus sp. WF146]UYZ13939.1 flagellar hook-basal body protein [Brevibacillus sp. WF146]